MTTVSNHYQIPHFLRKAAEYKTAALTLGASAAVISWPNPWVGCAGSFILGWMAPVIAGKMLGSAYRQIRNLGAAAGKLVSSTQVFIQDGRAIFGLMTELSGKKVCSAPQTRLLRDRFKPELDLFLSRIPEETRADLRNALDTYFSTSPFLAENDWLAEQIQKNPGIRIDVLAGQFAFIGWKELIAAAYNRLTNPNSQSLDLNTIPFF